MTQQVHLTELQAALRRVNLSILIGGALPYCLDFDVSAVAMYFE